MKILLQPYTAKVPPTKENPSGICAKQFKYFANIVGILRYFGHKLIQLGVEGEQDLGCHIFIKNASLEEINKLIIGCDLWISVDSFLQHQAHSLKKPGVVIWSVSDPKIFGYPENLNLYKSNKYFRTNQHARWLIEPYNEDSWLDYINIANKILDFGKVIYK